MGKLLGELLVVQFLEDQLLRNSNSMNLDDLAKAYQKTVRPDSSKEASLIEIKVVLLAGMNTEIEDRGRIQARLRAQDPRLLQPGRWNQKLHQPEGASPERRRRGHLSRLLEREQDQDHLPSRLLQGLRSRVLQRLDRVRRNPPAPGHGRSGRRGRACLHIRWKVRPGGDASPRPVANAHWRHQERTPGVRGARRGRVLPHPFLFCPSDSCGIFYDRRSREFNKLFSFGTVGRSTATDVLVSHNLNSLPEGERKILVFSDNRQDTAL